MIRFVLPETTLLLQEGKEKAESSEPVRRLRFLREMLEGTSRGDRKRVSE